MGSGTRSRLKVTARSRLQVVRNPAFHAEAYTVDDESNATLGVDSAEAEETHLQNAISASQQRHTRRKSNINQVPDDNQDKNKKQSNAQYHQNEISQDDQLGIIPTPDATGRVTNYHSLYKPIDRPEAWGYIKFSDSIDESQLGGLRYTIDERDFVFIQENNKSVKGEGTSSNTNVENGKSSMIIEEDAFELIMSVFEKITDDIAPTLHTVSSPDFFL